MKSHESELGEFLLWIAMNYQAVLLVLVLLGQLAVAAVYVMEAFGAPRWVAITALLMFPVVSWLVVKHVNQGENITSLTLATRNDSDSAPGSRPANR